ncbi:MAG TPA: single-stranded-DNA-specific exonuclease RecJ [Polyangiaceae bacterium]|nr:single-stranded-DNA-specific exonuclease RecJ [Polyangiaceae bacterium]
MAQALVSVDPFGHSEEGGGTGLRAAPSAEACSPEARRFARALGVSVTAADLLLRRGLGAVDEARRFLEPKLAHLTAPDGMVDRVVAARRLAKAVRDHERVCVFGDYDCDGITAAAILTDVLRTLGGDVVSLIASRFEGGYGVSPEAVDRIVASGAKLLVTCDCGSSDHPTLAEVVARGIDVIVIDHHLVPAEPLPAMAFLNPHRPDCGFPYKGLASCGLAFSVAAALRRELDVALDLRGLLDLVAIGTIADVAPLDGDNRALVRAGLRQLERSQRPGVVALLEACELGSGVALSARDVAFRIAPRINAPGRLGSAELSLELLLSRTVEQARELAEAVERASEERRALQQNMLAEALEEIEQQGYAARPAIVLGRPGWNHGIVGIVAGRLADRFAKPAIVVGFDGARGRGSVRGPAGARLHDALRGCSEVLLRFGGHQAAAGVEVELGRLEELRQRFERACERAPLGAPVERPPVTLLDPEDDLLQVVKDLRAFEPCGEQNPAPKLGVQAKVALSREVRGGHLKLELELPGGRRLSAFGPSLGGRAASLGQEVLVIGQLRPDRWRGGDAVELGVEQIV